MLLHAIETQESLKSAIMEKVRNAHVNNPQEQQKARDANTVDDERTATLFGTGGYDHDTGRGGHNDDTRRW